MVLVEAAAPENSSQTLVLAVPLYPPATIPSDPLLPKPFQALDRGVLKVAADTVKQVPSQLSATSDAEGAGFPLLPPTERPEVGDPQAA